MTIFLPKGYRFAAMHCGLKADPAKLDLSLIVSDHPATAAGVYTQNITCGAPVQVDRSRTPGEGFQAVVVNSRVANDCTGKQGWADAMEMTALAAQTVGAAPDKALVMSTGVIGALMPMEKIRAGIPELGKRLRPGEEAFLEAAHGFMTTDTVTKTASKALCLSDGTTINIAGICKGAAMIGPNMATMLALVMTDAALSPALAQKLLKEAVDVSFNCISVEGHTSPSDTVLLLANGAASALVAQSDIDAFADALRLMCMDLAKQIPADGEGCSHLITIDITGCKDRDSARAIARTIANDVLVKTSIYGADPNWGRIISAAGNAGVPFDPQKVSLKLNGTELYRTGTPLPFDNKAVSDSIRVSRETHFDISFAEGNAAITFWTTDLTTEYVRLNADYTT